LFVNSWGNLHHVTTAFNSFISRHCVVFSECGGLSRMFETRVLGCCKVNIQGAEGEANLSGQLVCSAKLYLYSATEEM